MIYLFIKLSYLPKCQTIPLRTKVTTHHPSFVLCWHVRVCACARSFVCFSCVFLYHAHVSMGPLQFLSERSAVDRQSQGQFLALSPRFVCGIPGMCRNVGSDRWRGPPQRQTPRHKPKPPFPLFPNVSLPKLVFLPPHYTLPGPSLLSFP